MIALGFVSCFYGRVTFRQTITAIGVLLIFFVFTLSFSIFGMMDWLDPALEGEAWKCILSFAISALFAGLGGWLLYKKGEFLMVFGLGVVAGFFLGVLIYELFLSGTDSVALLITFAVVGCIIGAILAHK
jgi:hypothetical protein